MRVPRRRDLRQVRDAEDLMPCRHRLQLARHSARRAAAHIGVDFVKHQYRNGIRIRQHGFQRQHDTRRLAGRRRRLQRLHLFTKIRSEHELDGVRASRARFGLLDVDCECRLVEAEHFQLLRNRLRQRPRRRAAASIQFSAGFQQRFFGGLDVLPKLFHHVSPPLYSLDRFLDPFRCIHNILQGRTILAFQLLDQLQTVLNLLYLLRIEVHAHRIFFEFRRQILQSVMDLRQLSVELLSLLGIVLTDFTNQTENGTDLLHQRILPLRQHSRRLVRQLKQPLRVLRQLVLSQNFLILTGLQIRVTDFLQLMPQ